MIWGAHPYFWKHPYLIWKENPSPKHGLLRSRVTSSFLKFRFPWICKFNVLINFIDHHHHHHHLWTLQRWKSPRITCLKRKSVPHCFLKEKTSKIGASISNLLLVQEEDWREFSPHHPSNPSLICGWVSQDNMEDCISWREIQCCLHMSELKKWNA